MRRGAIPRTDRLVCPVIGNDDGAHYYSGWSTSPKRTNSARTEVAGGRSRLGGACRGDDKRARLGKDGQCPCAVPTSLVNRRRTAATSSLSSTDGGPTGAVPGNDPGSFLARGALGAIFSKADTATRAGAGASFATAGGRLPYLLGSSRGGVLADSLQSRLSPEVPGDILHCVPRGCGIARRARQVPDLPWAHPCAAARRGEGHEWPADRCHLANRPGRQVPLRSALWYHPTPQPHLPPP